MQPQPQPPAAVPERARLFLEAMLGGGGAFDGRALQGLRVVATAPGRAVCRLQVQQIHTNRYGTLHGGCIATLVDVVGSAALVTRSARGGVSLSIATHYLSPLLAGEEVEIDARVLKQGRDVATIEVLLRRAASGELAALGLHVKKLVAASDLSHFFSLAEQAGPGPAAGAVAATTGAAAAGSAAGGSSSDASSGGGGQQATADGSKAAAMQALSERTWRDGATPRQQAGGSQQPQRPRSRL